jgi:hypothetical protein
MFIDCQRSASCTNPNSWIDRRFIALPSHFSLWDSLIKHHRYTIADVTKAVTNTVGVNHLYIYKTLLLAEVPGPLRAFDNDICPLFSSFEL